MYPLICKLIVENVIQLSKFVTINKELFKFPCLVCRHRENLEIFLFKFELIVFKSSRRQSSSKNGVYLNQIENISKYELIYSDIKPNEKNFIFFNNGFSEAQKSGNSSKLHFEIVL